MWYEPKIRVKVSSRTDGHKKLYDVLLMDRNIITEEGKHLPKVSSTHILFDAETSNIYRDYDKNKRKVNTRLRYPNSPKYQQKYEVFCYLNLWQRIVMTLVERKSWFHKHPRWMALYALNIIGFIVVPAWLSNRSANLETEQPASQEQTMTTQNDKAKILPIPIDTAQVQVDSVNIEKVSNDSVK